MPRKCSIRKESFKEIKKISERERISVGEAIEKVILSYIESHPI